MFLDLKGKLRPMIKEQKENIKVHKENMDLKAQVAKLDRVLQAANKKHQVQLDRYKSNLKSVGHRLEEVLRSQG